MTERTNERGTGVTGTRTRAATWLAWSLATLSMVVFVATIVLDALARSVQSTGNSTTVATISETVSFLLFLTFPVVGALIASRRPENPVGWICLADGLLWGLLTVTESYSVYGAARPGSVPFPVAIGTVGTQWLWVPTVGLLGIYLILLLPDGKLPSGRWRPFALFSAVVIVSQSVAEGLAPGPLENQGGVSNPFGLEALPWLQTAAYVILPLLPLCILAAAVSMVQRYRSSRGEVRQQIKWVAFVASFAGLLYLGALLSPLIFQPEIMRGAKLSSPPLWFELLSGVAVLGFAGVPVAIGFAVLKYRLYDIDIIINRALVYGPLTVSLAAVYIGGVATTQALFRTLTGQTEQPQLAVVVSTLAIAALFNPLRRRIQGFIDRRFYRRKYDARKTLEAYSTRLRDETDLATLNEDLAAVIRETLQPEHVSLWLRPDKPAKEGQT
jgi:hypothetical protein